jgi:hypothetical protein
MGCRYNVRPSRMPYPCALSIPYSTSVILCVHWNRLWNLEVQCTDARCGGRTWHILHRVNHRSGPVYQPPSSLALDRDPWARPMGSVVTEVAVLLPHGYTNLAINARAGLRPVLAVRPGGRSAGGTLAACPLRGA